MTEVQIKPLEWHKSHVTPWMDDWHTTSPLIYTIRCADENGWKWSCSGAGAHGYAGSPEDAKEDAQAHFEATVRSALSATLSGMAEPVAWHPIETAPRDRPILATNGTDVHEVVYSPKGQVTNLDGSKGPKNPFPWEFLHKGKRDAEASVDAWFSSDVTHWQPLPAPPALQTEGK